MPTLAVGMIEDRKSFKGPRQAWAWHSNKSATAFLMPMQSSLNWVHALSGDRVKRLVSERLYWLVHAAAMSLFALAALLFWRRAVGAIHEPLPMPGIVVAAIILGLLAGFTHLAGRLIPAKKSTALLSEIALSLALLAVAATLSLPATPVVGLSLFWLIILIEEGWAWRTRLHRAHSREDTNTPARFRESEAPAEPQTREGIASHYSARREPRPPEITKPNLESAETIPPEEVTQQLTRSTAADGAEELAGWLRVPFTAGQRTLSVHLAFCPPFVHTPELFVEQIDGPAARIKTAQVLPYGARLDLKLHAAAETPAGVVLHFNARVEGMEKES